jgi:hypothetical protein
MPAIAQFHNNTKIGCCPHGMPMGACPICSGMAGGNSTTKRDVPRNVGEMTYNQCLAIGLMLKNQKAARQRAEQSQQNFLQAVQQFQKTLDNAQNRILQLTQMVSNSMPKIIAAPVNLVLNIAGKVLNIVANVNNIMINIAQKFADITDKLTAMYGEFKAAVQKGLSNLMSGIKKKLKSMFFIFGADETDDENQKIEEAQKAFNLKTFLHNLSRKFKREEERIAEYEH